MCYALYNVAILFSNSGYTLCTNHHEKGYGEKFGEKMTNCELPQINHYTLFIVHLNFECCLVKYHNLCDQRCEPHWP